MAEQKPLRFAPTPEQRARIRAALGECKFFEYWSEVNGEIERVIIGVWATTADGRPREARYECAPFEVKAAWGLIADAAEKKPKERA